MIFFCKNSYFCSLKDCSEMKYGLIGFPLGHSFSQRYFTEKFADEGLPHTYEAFPLASIGELPTLLRREPDLAGFNVTIPYKEQVIPLLDAVDDEAKAVGAVNTVCVARGTDGTAHLTGYNTDVYGFREALREALQDNGLPLPPQALVLGTGGAAKGVVWVLERLGVMARLVSRREGADVFKTYATLTTADVAAHRLIVNATPIGMYPRTDACPAIPYEGVGIGHLLFDLVYNPPLTRFLEEGKNQGACVRNGERMLYEQADKAWEIWTHQK
jgi:shikimate dehydrogenase